MSGVFPSGQMPFFGNPFGFWRDKGMETTPSLPPRPSDRVAIVIQIRIFGADVDGRAFAEEARTLEVSHDGAMILTKRHLTPQDEIMIRRERTGKVAHPARVEQPRPARVELPARVEQPKPAITENRSPVRTDNSDVYRGRDVQNIKPESRSGYGGYGDSRDAAAYRERGKTSRENMQNFNRPAPNQQPAISGGRESAPGPAGRQGPSGGGGGGGSNRHR